MIGKISTGKSFRGCLNYLHEGRLQQSKALQEIEQEKKQAQVICYNQCFGNKKELIQQFNEVQYLNPKLSKPVLHASLSFAHSDQLSNQDKIDIGKQMAKDFGFENNQYVVIEHGDRQHHHLHIVANRVGYDAKTVSDSNNYKRMANFCRTMERKHQLEQVLSPRRFLSKEERMLPRQDIRKEALKEAIAKFLKQSTTMKEFQNKITAKGYEVELGRGIAFTDAQAVRFKGSQVGYPLLKIEKQLAQNRQMQQEELQKPSLAQQLRERILRSQREEQLKRQQEDKQEIKQSGGFRL
ncbi:relaxase/mobilization nuclease domain-containing protein [Mucilaginibacter flavidus]|uniref:relaxase/mobilization nuclease domain-containing protein n=1 Tax=Mucilaginibacter flavidus TaxID=2949309 RepID=UPI002093154C|nr:relaxase/mobilization nuclease domain-containing protein [Mucilaginibacter flavidus]MCO5949312.1 relaxase/mobilization nuclease domain-containing protein [Mucilaginibacter flavidus]